LAQPFVNLQLSLEHWSLYYLDSYRNKYIDFFHLMFLSPSCRQTHAGPQKARSLCRRAQVLEIKTTSMAKLTDGRCSSEGMVFDN
jgi:hypothetical protein